MSNTTKKELYPAYCTECGAEIRQKNLNIDELLLNYDCPVDALFDVQENEAKLKSLLKFLHISVPFGGTLLPPCPAFINDGGFYLYTEEDISKLIKRRTTFMMQEYREGGYPAELYTPVHLSIERIVAQFVRMTGFTKLYELLYLHWEESKEYEARYNELVDEFSRCKELRFKAMDMDRQSLLQQVSEQLDTIISFAEAEAKSGINNFDRQQTSILWVVRRVNNRELPYALEWSSNGKRFSSVELLCPECANRVPYEFGAYEQKIIGILGEARSGKTSYLAALLDALDRGEAVSHQGHSTPFSFALGMVGDVQWSQVIQPPARSESEEKEPGMLWFYRKGYEQKTTDINPTSKTGEARSPSLLLTPSGGESGEREPMIYTLADIPGEAFDIFNETGAQTRALIQKNHSILFRADYLLLMVNSAQLLSAKVSSGNESAKETGNNSPQETLKNALAFLPDSPIPVMAVLTAADRINDGELREPLHLGYDPRRVSALVWSEKQKTLVYNTELMDNSLQAFRSYLNESFGGFLHALEAQLQNRWHEGGRVEGFVVSSGAQKAVRYSSELDNENAEEQKKRYAEMRGARFGVMQPIHWLLAREGWLPCGMAEHRFTDLEPRLRKKLTAELQKKQPR